MYPDPFINDSPLWEPWAGPPEADLGQVDHHATDLHNFIRQNSQPSQSQPQPNLPRGMTLNELNDGRWVLVYPDGARGYRAIEGSRDELLQITARWTTE